MKNKNTSAILAFLLGVFGIHRFYLGQVGLGILYVLLSMTTISVILGILDGIIFLTMDDDVFDAKYNNKREFRQPRQRRQTRPDFRRPPRTTRRQERGTAQQQYRRQRRTAPPAPRTTRQRPQAARRVPTHSPKKNPFKASGIRKFKDFEYDGAIEDFNQALKIAPKDVSIHFNIACAYSLMENTEKSFYHLSEAVQLGFNDFGKIDTHDALAYVRIQPNWEDFKQNGYTLRKQLAAPEKNLLDDDVLLLQIKKLNELKEKGLITEKEFLEQKQKLMR
ncbi:MAG: NINE protein [Saprospiraceae bacterium]|nr:NINE protein [Saprospiraceae bacterium]